MPGTMLVRREINASLNTPVNTTILSSIRFDSKCVYITRDAPQQNGIPTLNLDDIAIMDKMRSHHARAVKDFPDKNHIQYLYLSPYSLDLNPLEILRRFASHVAWDILVCLVRCDIFLISYNNHQPHIC